MVRRLHSLSPRDGGGGSNLPPHVCCSKGYCSIPHKGVGCPSVISGVAPTLPPVLRGLGRDRPLGPHLLPSTHPSGCALSSYSPRGWAVRAFTGAGPVPFQKGPLGLSTEGVCLWVGWGDGGSCPAPAGWHPGSGARYTCLGVAHRECIRSVFIPVPKKRNAKECAMSCAIAIISHASRLPL